MNKFGSVYEASVIHFGYKIFFYFSDPMEAVKFKEGIEKEYPNIEIKIKYFKVIHELPKNFVESVLEVFSKVDQIIEEEKNEKGISNMSC